MNGASRREYLAVIYARYGRAGLQEKREILSEFCRNTGYNRKYAIRLLNGPPPNHGRQEPRRRHRLASYNKAVIAVLGEATRLLRNCRSLTLGVFSAKLHG